MRFGSLFAGIGGFDLGLERAGMECAWQVEIDEYCRRVLAKHWPDVPRWDDVRTFPPKCRDWGVDLICGGFPCQDISAAGHGTGLDGERSGLWAEYRRCLRELRPRYVVVENSPALTFRGLDRVLGDLASLGFDAEWNCIPAETFGAPHERDRIWIIAHASGERCGQGWKGRFVDRLPWLPDQARWNPADAERLQGGQRHDTEMFRGRAAEAEQVGVGSGGTWWGNQWPNEPALLGVDDGIPARMDRVRVLGNTVVPQLTEWIGRKILESVEQP